MPASDVAALTTTSPFEGVTAAVHDVKVVLPLPTL